MKRFVAFVGRYNGAPRKLLRRKKRNLGFYKLNGNFAIQSFGKIRISIFRPPTANLRVGGRKSLFFRWLPKNSKLSLQNSIVFAKEISNFFRKGSNRSSFCVCWCHRWACFASHISSSLLLSFKFLANFYAALRAFRFLFTIFFSFKLFSLLFPLRNLKFPVSKLLSMWSEQNFRCQRGPSSFGSYIIIFFV